MHGVTLTFIEIYGLFCLWNIVRVFKWRWKR